MERGTNSGASVQSNSIRDRVAQAYYSHGLFCSSHPYTVIFVTVGILVVCCYPLLRLPLLGSSSQHFKTSVSDFAPPSIHPSDSEEYAFTNPRWFQGYPVGFIQQVVVKSAVLPWKSNFILTDAFRAPIAEAFHIRELINNHQIAYGSNHTVSLSDICLQVSEPIDELAFRVLPHFGCFLLSPTNIWKHDLTQFQQDDNIVKSVFSLKDSTVDSSSLREIVFGVPWKESGIKQFNVRSRPRVLTYSFTMIFQTLDLQFLHSIFEQLRSKYPSNPYTENTTYFPEESFITHLYFQDLHTLSEFVPLGVAYIILFLYIYFSVRKIELVKSKWALAISAVMTVVMSLLMSVGLCLWFGLNPTLNGSEILPYLIVVIGLENMLILTKSIVSTPDHLDVKLRVAQGLSKEGWSITKNLLTELAVLTVAFLTFVPKIQEFCLFAVVGLFTDFFLQLVFFATFLSIDIRRIEVSDIHKNRLLRNINEQNKHDFLLGADSLTKTPLAQSRAISSNIRRKVSKNMPDSSAKIFAPTSNPMLSKLPKRMKFIYFWARTRIVQRGLMISLGVWIIFWVYSSGVIERLSETTAAFVPIAGVVRPIFQKFTSETNASSDESHSEIPMGNGDQTNMEYSPKSFGSRLKHHNLYLWQTMPAQHWTTLFGYYNISLTGRYISILPPLHLSISIDPNTVSELRTPADIETSKRFYWQFLSSDQGDKDVDDLLPTDLTYHPSSPAEVGLAIALTSITFFFFVYLMVVLYRCMCTKHYAEWRTSWNNSNLNADSRRNSGSCQETSDSCLITETLPIALHAHHQEIENIVADSNLIVSSCLNGDICVWDSVSGECMTSIKRSSAFIKTGNCAIKRENLTTSNTSDFKSCETKNEILPNYNTNRNLFSGESMQVNHLPFQPTWCMDFCDMCIALGCKDGRLEVWNAFTGNLDYAYVECKSGITAISLSENRLVAARLNGTVDFFTVQVSRKENNFENNVEHEGSHCSQNALEYVQCSWFLNVKAHTLSVSVLVIDNSFAITGGFDRLVKVFRSDSAACIYTLHGHSAQISALHIDQSSPLSALSACQDGVICLWDLTTGTCMYSLNGHHGAVMALNSTFIYMISQGTDNRICIWEKCQGHLLHSINQEFSLHSTAVLLTSNVIVTTKEDNLVLWDVNHGEALRMIMVGNGSHSCHIKILRLCGQSIVCDYGPQMFIINFPAIKLD